MSAVSLRRSPGRASRRPQEVEIGGTPRVNLLPTEIVAAGRARTLTRRLVAGLAGLAVVTATSVGVAALSAADANRQLAQATAQTQPLLTQQAAYAEASALENLVATVEQARSFGASAEIDWANYLDLLRATMPTGMVMLDTTVTAAPPWESPATPAGPLRGDPAATLRLHVKSASEADITAWVRSLEQLPGYADSSLDNRTADASTDPASYEATVTLNLTVLARSDRFPAAKLTTTTATD